MEVEIPIYSTAPPVRAYVVKNMNFLELVFELYYRGYSLMNNSAFFLLSSKKVFDD